MATQLWVNYGGVWRGVVPGTGDIWTKVSGTWRPTMKLSAMAGGSWRQIFLRSDPTVWRTYFGTSSTWSQVYRGTSGVTSTRSNDNDLGYFGFSYNNEIERSMMSVYDFVGNQIAADDRPVVKSANSEIWVGHVYSGTDTVYLGIDDATSRPSTFQRLHSERDSSYGHAVYLDKPGSGAGALDTQAFSVSKAQNWWNKMISNDFNALTVSAEQATDPNNLWGWVSGTQHSTGNSGGIPSGLNNLSWSDSQVNRIAWTIDFS